MIRIPTTLLTAALMHLLTVGSVLASDSTLQVFGQIRPRTEFRNGYRTLPSPTRNDGVLFTTQRTRLGVRFDDDRLAALTIIMQDVRTWGDETGTSTDFNADNFDVHRAFVDLSPDSHWTIRIGRQGFGYDEDRILGDGEWSQQGRSHDAVRVMWKSGNTESHVALEHHERGEPIGYDPYPANSIYQDLALAWIRVRSNGLIVSALAVADFYEGHSSLASSYPGLPSERGTVGPRMELVHGNYKLRVEGYYQFGTIASVVDELGFEVYSRRDIRAFMTAANLTRAWNKSEAVLWFDYLSGDENPLDDSYEVFDPPYATTHRYYGWADYFINIPADTRGFGLIDLALKLKTPVAANTIGDLQLHYYSYTKESALSGPVGFQRALGFEADAMLTIPLAKNLKLQGGYSIVIPTKALEALDSGTGPGHWVWTMLDFSVPAPMPR